MRRLKAVMKRLKQSISTILMFLVISGGAFGIDQKKDEQKPPPKDQKHVVPVAPKSNPPNGGGGDRGNGNKKP
jgi:hypothetical protein